MEPTLVEFVFPFDESCPNWSPEGLHNVLFLRGIQNHANRVLQSTGVLFLNQPLSMIGLPLVAEGQTHGWAWTSERADLVKLGIHGVPERMVTHISISTWGDVSSFLPEYKMPVANS